MCTHGLLYPRFTEKFDKAQTILSFLRSGDLQLYKTNHKTADQSTVISLVDVKCRNFIIPAFACVPRCYGVILNSLGFCWTL